MSGYFRFLALYRTRTLGGAHFKVIVDPVTVESFDGPRSFGVPQQITRVHPIGEGHQAAVLGTLSLPAGERFLALTARSKEITPSFIPQIENTVDRIVTQLSISFQPHLFFEQVYRGPIFENRTKWWASMSVRPGHRITIDGNHLLDQVGTINRTLSSDPELDRRYTLMSRFYSCSLQFDPSEEKFLLQWTCLEIFPMCDTSNIAPLVVYLSNIVRRPASIVKEKLQIGRLHGIRSKLVHDGILQAEGRHLLFKQLELIVHAVMRSMCRLPYDNALDQYFDT